ncbi:MAG TPA: phosphatase PAP2 family protein [Solirubrobacteraceae bacterium]|nr:phosphatase PAP2 family protein [Solirubrobacteraceae bacterium]
MRAPIRFTAGALVATGVALPIIRRRFGVPRPVVLASTAGAPLGAAVLMPPGRARNVTVCCLQMWGYFTAYEMPNDDPEALAARVHIQYPIDVDRVLGLGRVPSQRLQRAFSTEGRINRFERVLVWCHWVWFPVPHAALLYVLMRRPERFGPAAARVYATFDLGAVVYWLVPTAPPWWAARQGYLGHEDPLPVRRMMREYGEEFWKSRWDALFQALGGNPLAAMPSMHFASSVMAARALAEVGPVAGAVGWAYAGTLGLALVYLGEHYAVDLVAGGLLAGLVRRGGRRLGRPAQVLVKTVDTLGRVAAGDPTRSYTF